MNNSQSTDQTYTMKTLLTLTLTVISLISFSQTDIIEMRSRNAFLKKYERTSKSNSFDHVASNFGMSPTREVRNAVLDSVKVLSDSVAIMYTSNYCSRVSRFEPLIINPSDTNQQQKEKLARTYPNPRVGYLWQPGADTVVNHPLFIHRHSLDSVKQVIDNSYHFNLPSDSIEFIGFDNAQSQSNADSVLPVKQNRRKKNSFGWELIFMLVTPIVFMLGISRFVIPKSSAAE